MPKQPVYYRQYTIRFERNEYGSVRVTVYEGEKIVIVLRWEDAAVALMKAIEYLDSIAKEDEE